MPDMKITADNSPVCEPINLNKRDKLMRIAKVDMKSVQIRARYINVTHDSPHAAETRQTIGSISVLNGPGPPQGAAGGLPRALDGTGRQKAVRSRPGNLRTAVIVKDGGPYNVRQIGLGIGERARLRGTAGDCRAEFLHHSIISHARQKHEYVQNIIKEACYPVLTNGGVDS